MTESYLLSIILFAPFAGAVVLLFISNRRPFLVRQIAVLKRSEQDDAQEVAFGHGCA